MTILDLIKDAGFGVKFHAHTGGGEFCGPCPWCGGTDRFLVWPVTNRYWCRNPVCGKKGNDITWLVDYKKIPFREAIKILGKEKYFSNAFNHLKPVSRNTYKDEFAFLSATRPPALWSEKAEKFAQWAHDNLKNDTAAISYLQERGISAETMRVFKLGLNDQEFYREPAAWGIEREKKIYIPPGLVIPTFADGRVVRIRVRRDGEVKNRYYIVPGSSSESMLVTTMGLTPAPVVVVEAELDGLLIHQEAGDLVHVIATGSTAIRLTREQYRVIKQQPLILLAFDFDEAGQLGCKWWSKQFRQAKRFPTPRGKDPGDAFRLGVNIREWILTGLPWISGRVTGHQPRQDAGSAGGLRVTEEECPASPELLQKEIGVELSELIELLKISGATIINEPGRLSIEYRNQWDDKHRLQARKLSKLVYFDDAVLAHLDSVGESRVTWKNLGERQQ